ncbi:MAG: hypothetical protein COB17_03010 [Sulfurimonas sp.]|nr:MAG: hypothetical protein COB17_03010 [Sulfurimonas sp.]
MKIIFIIAIIFNLLQADYIRDDAKEIIVDTTTNLIWQDNATTAAMTWSSSISYCESLSLGSFSDWRLANITELTSLVDFTLSSPSINSKFKNINTNHYWSSTTKKSDTLSALDINFIYGNHHSELKTASLYVRCVRAGQ